MAPQKVLYNAQFYRSPESNEGPYAATPDEALWGGVQQKEVTYDNLQDAINRCKKWAKNPDSYKSCRVVELNEDLQPTGIAWMSAWEAPLSVTTAADAGATGVPGFTCKLLVWMDRDDGPVDHFDWVNMLNHIFGDNTNAWDVEYGRPMDTNGRMIQYSIKINVWPVEKKHPSRWDWYRVFGKDPELQRDEIEFVRAHEIGAREFPSGVEVNECFECGKLHLASTTWRGWDNESDEMQNFCSCRCIDKRMNFQGYRQDPDGEEHDSPGCVAVREGSLTPR